MFFLVGYIFGSPGVLEVSIGGWEGPGEMQGSWQGPGKTFSRALRRPNRASSPRTTPVHVSAFAKAMCSGNLKVTWGDLGILGGAMFKCERACGRICLRVCPTCLRRSRRTCQANACWFSPIRCFDLSPSLFDPAKVRLWLRPPQHGTASVRWLHRWYSFS